MKSKEEIDDSNNNINFPRTDNVKKSHTLSLSMKESQELQRSALIFEERLESQKLEIQELRESLESKVCFMRSSKTIFSPISICSR